MKKTVNKSTLKKNAAKALTEKKIIKKSTKKNKVSGLKSEDILYLENEKELEAIILKEFDRLMQMN